MSKLRCIVFDGDRVSPDGDEVEKVFDQDVVKIGRLESSHLRLEGVARMHAVLARAPEGWRVIDLGSSVGTKLDGRFVDKNEWLGQKGRLEFGRWIMTYEVVGTEGDGVKRDRVSEARERLGNLLEPDDGHHEKLARSLIDEMKKLSPDSAKAGEKILAMWSLRSPEQKRKFLRLAINVIREHREGHEIVQRQMVAGMLRLGPEGVAEIYELEPAQALVQARESLVAIAQAKDALETLNKLNLRETVKSVPRDDPESKQSLAEFLAGHQDLEELLQQEVTQHFSVLTACISRAGGHTLTHRERVELKKAFEQVRKAAEGQAASGPTSG